MTTAPDVVARTTQHRTALEERWGPWRPRTTAQLLDEVTAEDPGAPFFLTEDRSWTYGDIAALSLRLAAGLRALGVGPGDHVATDLCNLPETAALKFAVARLGAVSVSVNFLLRHEELGYVLRQSRACVLITMDAFRGLDYLEGLDKLVPGWEQDAGGTVLPDLKHVVVLPLSGASARGTSLDELVERGRSASDDEVRELTRLASPDAVSDLLYTSGTTGAAKGVLLRHDAVLRTAYASAYTRAFSPGYRILYAMPMYHVFGYVEALLAVLFVRGAVVPHRSFDASKMLVDVGRHQVDEMMAVPAMTCVLLEEAAKSQHDLSSLRVMFSSGAAHADGMFQQMIDVLGVEQLFTAYGQTETTASTLCTLPGDPLDRLVGTNGCHKPAGVAGADEPDGFLAVYKAVDSETGEDLPPGSVGELVVRGPIVTTGYYDKPEETAALFTADGWMRTGDLGRFDEQGYLSLTGRKKESYRCGGELVMPSEIEAVLGDHPGVRAAHVVGVPHPRMGEVGCAWVVADASGRPDPDALLSYCSGRLARFKVPAHVLFIDAAEVPLTVTGRVQKFQLVQRALAELAQLQAEAPVEAAAP